LADWSRCDDIGLFAYLGPHPATWALASTSSAERCIETVISKLVQRHSAATVRGYQFYFQTVHSCALRRSFVMSKVGDGSGLLLSISAVARETGLSKDVLRMWERRTASRSQGATKTASASTPPPRSPSFARSSG
jgi:hypothetical protein